RPPIARECLNRRELHALGLIRDRFPFRPLRCVDAPVQFGQLRLRNVHTKWTNCICLIAALCSNGLGHGVRLLSSFGYFGLSHEPTVQRLPDDDTHDWCCPSSFPCPSDG